MTTPPQKISLYSISELKNATDDAIAPYLTDLPVPYRFRQQHSLTHVRLALGYTAVIIAAALFAADYKLGWDATKPYTLPACVAYFALNSALTYWVWGIERGTVFAGTREGGQKLTIRSSVKKHDPTYRLRVSYKASSGKSFYDTQITGKFTEWFNTYGYLQKKEFRSWLARNIEVVGLADPVTHTSGERKYEDRVDETITVASGAETSSTTANATPGKRGRPKKKI